jgi:hypothetical protein
MDTGKGPTGPIPAVAALARFYIFSIKYNGLTILSYQPGQRGHPAIRVLHQRLFQLVNAQSSRRQLQVTGLYPERRVRRPYDVCVCNQVLLANQVAARCKAGCQSANQGQIDITDNQDQLIGMLKQ